VIVFKDTKMTGSLWVTTVTRSTQLVITN